MSDSEDKLRNFKYSVLILLTTPSYLRSRYPKDSKLVAHNRASGLSRLIL